MLGSVALPWSVIPRRFTPRPISPARGLPFWQEKTGEIVVALSLFDVNWRELFDLVTDGGPPPRHVCLRIMEGVEIRGMYAVALDVGDWPTGTNLTLENYGRIQGAGGEGGRGGDTSSNAYDSDGYPGGNGGDAFYTRHDVTLTNEGTVGGGGGGGGGSSVGNGANGSFSGGGGGGGGAGPNAGAGGSGGKGTASSDDGYPGDDGALTSGGDGGREGDTDTSVIYGGDGGGPGESGQKGDDDFASGGAGGSPGNAVDGDSHVTYETIGDIRGNQVN